MDEDHNILNQMDMQASTINSKNDFVSEEIAQPYIGLEFDSLEMAKEFYMSFAKKKGFGVRIRSGKPKSYLLGCCSEGQHKGKNHGHMEINNNMGKVKKKCSTLRSGYQASLMVKENKKTKKWVVKDFNNDHNHVMISPKSVSYLRCHKKMSVAAKNLVEKFQEGIPTGKVSAMFNNGNSTFSNRDCWNHIRNLRKKVLDVGDAQAVFNYCKQKQVENSNFFYAIQCDDEDRMVNFFWINDRSRVAYQHFGDVVTFDTTYKTNKYSMPFAPFTGLNHHYQSILFRCALLQDESERSFTWLVETWLEAMNGKKPISIITDQDLAIGATVAKVFPETHHRLCLWHIKKKFPEKLAHIYHKNVNFKHRLKSCIRESPTTKDFEEEWQCIMLDYNLEENEWLQGLFEIRKSWVPIYNRSIFFAGMNTTQRSESINAFFDSFVNSTTTLQEFVLKYEKAMENRYEAERKEDFESRHKARILSVGSKIEEHAASVYTKAIFGKFQEELLKINKFTKEKIEKNGSNYMYKVINSFDPHDASIVNANLASNIFTYGCQLYEFLGILCRHILVIFQAKNIVQIPNHYILYRWTKEANKDVRVSSGDMTFDTQDHSSMILKSIHIQSQVNKLSDLAGKSDDMYKFIMTKLDQIYKKAARMEIEKNDLLESSQHYRTNEQVNELSQLIIGDPHISQTKGRKKDAARLKSGLEVSMNKSVKRRACHVCGGYGHNKRSCKQSISLAYDDGLTKELSQV